LLQFLIGGVASVISIVIHAGRRRRWWWRTHWRSWFGRWSTRPSAQRPRIVICFTSPSW